jgi:DNA (cytosine-5)-methyltransferase 1
MSIKVFDFFSGCGGTSQGFTDAGLEVCFALDIDADSIATFQTNFPSVHVLHADIRDVSPEYLSQIILDREKPLLFCACAPCQPFSRQNRHKKEFDPRKSLLFEFVRFIKYWKPEYVLIENVPGLQRFKESGPLDHFKMVLDSLGYDWSMNILPALWFGVPQKRERLVLLASTFGNPGLPEPTHGPSLSTKYSNVREWIQDLPIIAAGERYVDDTDHEAAKLSELNLRRIAKTPEGKGRESWPQELRLDCHSNGHKGHSDVYGRLSWDKPASGLTTRCISYSNGRFGHPEQNRAISLREAACLQTFPRNYRFIGGLQSRARQVGNAVPPLMARKLAEHLLNFQDFQ